ncbi:myosin heavy chain, clone 203-like [Gigantopelta aegis]|uniref:myosin heavy chain, clone 203-like n=1 Tax=Gigantopelta aegis TaxID=1735272 RepID=UPI001B88D911|nr:myosin heavy chain, clone 203-like [Gigantopelta aegis]
MAERRGISLRSRSPSPARSADFIRNKGLPKPDMSFKGTGIFKKNERLSSSTGHLRKSIGTQSSAMLSQSLKEGSDLTMIEAEYIKNLQQQIYFLELEANYLRDQANKATVKYPKMTAEAERMLARLKAMEKQMGEMQMELKRRNMVIEMSLSEKERLTQQIKEEKDKLAKEKRLWTDELVQLKKAKDRLEVEMVRKDTQLLEAKSEIDKSAAALSGAEVRISSMKKQLQEAVDQLEENQSSVEEKTCTLEMERKELEEKLSITCLSLEEKDRENQELRDELSALRYKFKDLEISVQKHQLTQERAEEERSRLEKENEQLRHQVTKYAQQLDRGDSSNTQGMTDSSPMDERPPNKPIDRRYSDPLSFNQRQLDCLFKEYKPLDKSMNYRCSEHQLLDSGSTSYSTQDGRPYEPNSKSLNHHKSAEARSFDYRYMDYRVSDRLPPTTSRSMSRSTNRSNESVDIHDILRKLHVEIDHLKEQKKIEQMKAQHYLEEMAQHELTKNYLGDADEHRRSKSKIEERDREILKVQHSLHSLETRLKNCDYQADMELSLQSQKWEEFGRLAESMRTLSHTMAAQAHSRATTTATASTLIQY